MIPRIGRQLLPHFCCGSPARLRGNTHAVTYRSAKLPACVARAVRLSGIAKTGSLSDQLFLVRFWCVSLLRD